jgi:hypothetical protein
MSNGDQSAVKMDMVAWLGGFKQGKPNSENFNRTQGFWGTERERIRRSSSKDVEEAMSGGLSKVFITICNITNSSSLSGQYVHATYVGMGQQKMLNNAFLDTL